MIPGCSGQLQETGSSLCVSITGSQLWKGVPALQSIHRPSGPGRMEQDRTITVALPANVFLNGESDE